MDNKQFKSQNLNDSIFDLRFFQVQIFLNPIIFFVHNPNPDPKLINLINELDCFKMYSEIILNNDKKDYQIDLLIHKNIELKEINTTLSSQEYFKSDNNKDLVVAGIEKGIEILKSESESVPIKSSPKLIVYLNYEEIDELYNYMSLIYKFQSLHPYIQLILLFDNSIVFLLNIGMNVLYLPDNLFTGKGVGLYPIKKSVISTKGFEWDVTDWETQLGKNISTSNEFSEKIANVFVHEGEVFLIAEIKVGNM